MGKSLLRDKIGGDFVIKEWFSPALEEMFFESDELDRISSEKIDLWIKNQLSQKIEELNKIEDGIVIVDRSPIDMIAFPTKNETMLKRAEKYYELYYSGNVQENIVPLDGVILHLKVDGETLRQRRIDKNTSVNSHPVLIETVLKDIERDELLFGADATGIYQVNTSGKNTKENIEQLKELVYDRKYDPLNLQEYLLNLIERLHSLEVG